MACLARLGGQHGSRAWLGISWQVILEMKWSQWHLTGAGCALRFPKADATESHQLLGCSQEPQDGGAAALKPGSGPRDNWVLKKTSEHS